MKSVRKRLTYANVMSSIAVFLVLGGGAAFAAAKLGKNTVGTKQLKNNAVTTAKIKNGAVTGAKIKASTLGTVPSATHASTADSATNATNANNAGHAGTADNASAADGMHFAQLHFTTGDNAGPTNLFSGDGLTLTAECSGANLEFTATTSVAHSEIYESGNYLSTYAGGYSENFNPGETEEVGNKIGDTSQDEVQGQLVYSTPGGSVVTAEFSLNDSTINGTGSGCSVQGTVQFS